MLGFSKRSRLILATVLSLLLGGALSGSPQLPRSLFQHWVHSYEEDTKSVIVYRPATYSFPLSRGRDGFEIQSSGEFTLFGMGPAEHGQKSPGHWERVGDHEIRVTFTEEKMRSRVLRILSVTQDVLRLERPRS